MLALVAGEGALPGVIMEALDRDERMFRLCELEGHPCDARNNRPVIRFRVETIGTFLNELARNGTSQVCFAGRINRPQFDPTAIDPETMPLIPDLMKAMQAGDDGALRQVMRLFEARGIEVVSPQDVAPDLLPQAGVLTQKQPDEQAQTDADRGAQIIAAMGQADVGQSCVVAGGQALAIEAIQGTDWMLGTLTDKDLSYNPEKSLLEFAQVRMEQARERSGHAGRGGCLVKASKPGQDRRVDMPTIGPATIERVHAARLDGIVLEAGGVFVLDVAACIEMADALDLFLWIRA